MNDHIYSISRMAAIHELSRQTLIYYDRIGLFKPAYQNEKGYRFYTLEQCPLLREIRLLVTLNVPLKEIVDYVHHKNLPRAIELLTEQLEETENKIRELREIKKILKLRLENFRKVSLEGNFGKLKLIERPVRYYTSLPYESQPNIDDVSLLFRRMISYFRLKERSHDFVKYYKELQFKHGQLLLRKEALTTDDIFEKCGAVICSNEEVSRKLLRNMNESDRFHRLPAGLYATTLYIGSLEESEEAVRDFLKRIDQYGMKIEGDLIFTAILEQPFIMDRKRQIYELEVYCRASAAHQV